MSYYRISPTGVLLKIDENLIIRDSPLTIKVKFPGATGTRVFKKSELYTDFYAAKAELIRCLRLRIGDRLVKMQTLQRLNERTQAAIDELQDKMPESDFSGYYDPSIHHKGLWEPY